MRRAARFLALLLGGLAILATVAYFVVIGVTREWFAKDLRLRAELAVAAARQGLVSHWGEDRPQLTETLTDITRDERIMGAAACSMEGRLLGANDRSWTMTAELASGTVQLDATVLETDARPLGVVLLVHDLSFISRREAAARNFLLTSFFVLALVAALITLLAARLAWRGWTLELRRALSGHETQEFQPLVRDVRALVQRLASERDSEVRSGPW